jgi:hypothetical protein
MFSFMLRKSEKAGPSTQKGTSQTFIQPILPDQHETAHLNPFFV